MNIGIFTDTYSPQVNGVVSSILTLEKELRRKGHNVYVFTISHPEADDHSNYIYRIASLPFMFLKDYRVGILYSNKLVRKIKRLKLDIILSQTEFSLGIFAKLVSKKLSIPIVHTYHTMYEEYMHYISKGIDFSPKIARKYSKSFCNGVDGVVAPTKKTERLLKSYGVKTQIRIIPTGIDFSPLDKNNYSVEEIENLKQMFGIPLKDPIVLFVGRIAQEKSIDVIINAMKILALKVPKAKLVIVGDGPERLKLAKLAAQLEIQEAVIFTGMQPWNTIGKIYQMGDVFVSASVSETQGLTFAEAMAASIPVVAKHDESIAGLILDGYNGRLFDTIEELAIILEELFTSQKLQLTLGLNAVHSVKPLSAEVFGLHACDYYAEVINEYNEKKNLHKDKKTKNKFY